jgi:hypothetical protein
MTSRWRGGVSYNWDTTYLVERRMTTTKRVLCERRLRRIPAQFSWIDQRLVFEGHLGRCDAHAAALYLLLVIVADAQGLSYWGDARVMRMLSTTVARLARAREDLLRLGLIAYERPLYQVLALDRLALEAVSPPSEALSPSPESASSASLVASSVASGVDHEAIRARLAQVRARLTGSA